LVDLKGALRSPLPNKFGFILFVASLFVDRRNFRTGLFAGNRGFGSRVLLADKRDFRSRVFLADEENLRAFPTCLSWSYFAEFFGGGWAAILQFFRWRLGGYVAEFFGRYIADFSFFIWGNLRRGIDIFSA